MVLENMTRAHVLDMKNRNKVYCQRCGHEILIEIDAFKRRSCFVTLCKCPECHKPIEY